MGEAVIFPGQGAQFEGMGRDWCEAYTTAQATFDEASEALGFSLSEACWGSGDEVHRTDVAQPGILTTSVGHCARSWVSACRVSWCRTRWYHSSRCR